MWKLKEWQLNIASRSPLNGGTAEKNIIPKAIWKWYSEGTLKVRKLMELLKKTEVFEDVLQ